MIQICTLIYSPIKACRGIEAAAPRVLRIGQVELTVGRPCACYEATTKDKETFARDKVPLKMLNSFRLQPGGVLFGQYVVLLTRAGSRPVCPSKS